MEKEESWVDVEFEIQHEKQARTRTVHGEEFDVVTEELRDRLERLTEEMKKIQEEIERLKVRPC